MKQEFKREKEKNLQNSFGRRSEKENVVSDREASNKRPAILILG